MKRIKILFVIDNIFHIGGGTEGQLSKLINYMDEREFEIHLAVLRHTSWAETDYFDCPKLILEIGSLKHPNTWRKIWQLGSFIRDKKFDIVQTYFPDSSIVGVIAGRWGKAGKIVIAQRNLGYNLNRGHLFALSKTSRWVDRYLVNCQAVKESLILKLGIPPDKIDIIYNGIEYQKFEKVNNDLRGELKRKLGIQNEELIVGLVSNFRPIKNVDGFLHAAAEVSLNFPQAKFLIIGGGGKPKGAKRLKELSCDLNIGHKVVWTGMVEDVLPYLGLMDVGVLSSLSEGLSNTILEYMASGLPVVATAVGGGSELISDGENGFLVPSNNASLLAKKVLLLLNNPELREKMGRTNQRIVQEKFSLRETIDNHQKYFRRLLSYANN